MSTIKTLYATSISAIDGTATATGTAVNTEFFPILAVQAVWSAGSSPVGTVTLEGSLDGTNFTAISGVSISVSGNSGAIVGKPTATLNADRFVRAVYTRTSGSGTISVYISGKQ